jgi:hypothetical protein
VESLRFGTRCCSGYLAAEPVAVVAAAVVVAAVAVASSSSAVVAVVADVVPAADAAVDGAGGAAVPSLPNQSRSESASLSLCGDVPLPIVPPLPIELLLLFEPGVTRTSSTARNDDSGDIAVAVFVALFAVAVVVAEAAVVPLDGDAGTPRPGGAPNSSSADDDEPIGAPATPAPTMSAVPLLALAAAAAALYDDAACHGVTEFSSPGASNAPFMSGAAGGGSEVIVLAPTPLYTFIVA